MHVISRDQSGRLTPSPDILKDNLAKYINEYRLIGDAIDILDARVVNYRVSISVVAAPNANKQEIAAKIISAIKSVSDIARFQIGMPIMESDFINSIINVRGVLSMVSLSIENLNGVISNREYSSTSVDMGSFYNKGFYFAEPGDIFELRYPDNDIEVSIQ